MGPFSVACVVVSLLTLLGGAVGLRRTERSASGNAILCFEGEVCFGCDVQRCRCAPFGVQGCLLPKEQCTGKNN